jgi:hypothetical protein
MTLTRFAQDYDQLPPGEQALFAEAVRRLLSDGLIWRDDDDDRRIYNFLARRGDLIAEYLAVAGWEMRHHDRASIYHVSHREGAHRRHFTRKTTIWLLVLRLMYAEQREKPAALLTRYPVVTIGEVVERYAAFLPNQRLREKTSLEEALRTLHSAKLIRAAKGGGLQANDTDKQIELLPALEIVIPANETATLADRLREYQTGETGEASESLEV